MTRPTARAMATALRTYHRPLDEGHLESWEQVVERVIEHQRWLWQRALKQDLNSEQEAELEELRGLILKRAVMPAGRTLWLGGTPLAKMRESSMFNCAFTQIETVYDLVDFFWLLLQGCGVGFRPVTGTLNGLRNPLQEIAVIRSTRTSNGLPQNIETYDPETRIWTLKVGDSAVAWAKAVGKLVANKFPAVKLILDFSEIRPAGQRLEDYGWLTSGDEALAAAFKKIAQILSDRADQLLSQMDIIDIANLLGTALTSRHSAQIALMEYGDPEWEEFALMKKEWWLKDNAHRQQSNNSLLFYSKPTRKELETLFHIIVRAGGSEPGFINAQEAKRRAPWFKGCNPCVEILLGNKSFCNLSEVNLLAFRGDKVGLERALVLAARMNYRQTMVDLRDEILQEAWHLNNNFLHLCGVSLTGIRARPELTEYDYKRMKNLTVAAAYLMAQELKSPLPKNVTCVKPSGTLSKIMGTEEWGEVPEGIHLPLGQYLLNWVSFSKHDSLVQRLLEAGYKVVPKPHTPDQVLVCFPVHYEHIPLLNGESAVEQLNWYAKLQTTWSEQNVSNTISYDPSEIPAMIDWFLENWDNYVGVSFIFRNDPTKRAQDLGYAYLPQEVTTEEEWNTYYNSLKPIHYSGLGLQSEWKDEGCLAGDCPIK